MRNKRYALLQQRLAAGPSAEPNRSDTRGSSKRSTSKRQQNSSKQASRKTSRQVRLIDTRFVETRKVSLSYNRQATTNWHNKMMRLDAPTYGVVLVVQATSATGSQGRGASQHATAQGGKSKQTQRVYSSVQGILRTLVQRGIFEETGLPVDTAGLRKMSQNHTGENPASIHTCSMPQESLC